MPTNNLWNKSSENSYLQLIHLKIIYIYIYIYIYICIMINEYILDLRGAFNKFPDFFCTGI